MHAANTNQWRDLTLVLATIIVFSIAFLLLKRFEAPPGRQPESSAAVSGHGEMAGLDKAATLPSDFDGLVAAGNRHMDDGSFAVAAEAYRRALEIDPSPVDVRTDYGACLYGMGLPDRAIDEFSKTLASTPGHAVALFNMGIAYHDLGQADSARVYWQRCLEVDPNGASAPAVRLLLDSLRG